MKLFYHPIYSELDLPPHHRFPIDKYRLLFERVMSHKDAKEHFELNCADAATPNDILRAHSQQYVTDFLQGTLSPQQQKRIGFPYSHTLVARTLQSVGNTMAAAKAALQCGLSINLAGGYHHAFADYGSGYCIFNDAAIAARFLIEEQLAHTVLIVDLDVHQGDGSAAILEDDSDIITLSLHGEQNFPRIKQHSDYDLALPNGCDDDTYLDTLDQALNLTIRLHDPDIIIYNAGADVYNEDELGVLALTLDGVRRRDTLVIETAKHYDIPLACVLGGGYQRDVHKVVDVHWQLLLSAHQAYNGI
ncbi:histone deacetylase [Pseudoalteromonas sp. SSDWG2]|uniref:histone deacetylase family protein n=1 Tax=Pseudoalteromonas sp. SSDWG2 TaxID=3139391 RepID=UPI003BACF40E